MMAALVTRRPHRPPPPRARSAWKGLLGAAALLLLSACYSGDFFDRLEGPDVVAAFRITSLTLIDPHFYTGDAIKCDDATSAYNQTWNDHLDAFEIHPTLVMSPLDPRVETATKLQIVPARCIAVGEDVNCDDVGVQPVDIVEVIFNNSLQGGMCGGPVMGSTNPDYAIDQFEPLSTPESPCFLSALIPGLKLPLGPSFRLPLSNVQISAAYDLEVDEEDPLDKQRLIEGLIVGFLPTNVGKSVTLGTLGPGPGPFVPWNVIAGAASCKTTIDDVDTAIVSHDGVWIYFNFTAERVAWSSGAPPMTDPPRR
jgi:hypothetical protein